MVPSKDTVDYFKSLINKMNQYHKNIGLVKQYITKRRIRDEGKITNLVIMSVLWTAEKMGDHLTENDVLVILGSKNEINSPNFMSLDPELKEMPLLKLMDAVYAAAKR
mgnify:CR=1 FL=1